MYEIERLISLGMSLEAAQEVAYWYLTQGDSCGFERYVNDLETHRYVQSVQS